MENEILDIGREAIFMLIKISTPILLIALTVGLLISLLQALTQIQEATLSFVPKMITIFFSLLLLMPFMLGHLKGLMERIFIQIGG